MRRHVVTLIALMVAVATFASLSAQDDKFGKVDQCTVVLKETPKPNHWMIEIDFTNDEPLFGMIFPLQISSTKGKISYDSTSFAGSRVEKFAVKIPFEDPEYTKTGKGLKLNVGLLGSIGAVPLELEPGSGLIARHYITGDKNVTTESIMIDTTFISPANTLVGTRIDAKTNVKPAFEFKRGK